MIPPARVVRQRGNGRSVQYVQPSYTPDWVKAERPGSGLGLADVNRNYTILGVPAACRV